MKYRTLIPTQHKTSKNISGNKRATLMLLKILCLPYQLSQYLDIFIKCLSRYNTLIWTAIQLYYRRIFNHSCHQVQTTHSSVVCQFISPKNILTGLSNRLFELLSQSVHFRFKRDLLFICKANNSIIIIKNLNKCLNKFFEKHRVIENIISLLIYCV